MTPDEVRTARLQLGLTQDELCARLGLQGPNAIRTVRRWEKPSRNEDNDRGPSTPAILAMRYMLADWLPIEMCPKDGTIFDVWDETLNIRVSDCKWSQGEVVSLFRQWSGRAKYFRLITPPPGLTMDGYFPDEHQGDHRE